MKYKVMIIDGTNYFIRYFSTDKSLNAHGIPCGGLSGVLKGLKYLIKDYRPNEIIFVFDGKNNSSRKKKIDETYKKGRKMGYVDLLPQDNKDLFHKQLSMLYNILNVLPIKFFSVDNIEADDCIAYISHLYDKMSDDVEKYIISRDNDFYQLINDNTFVIDPTKKIVLDIDKFSELYEMKPYNYHIYKTLSGDTSDNVDRIINKKTILKHFNEILNSDEIMYLDELLDYIVSHKIDVNIDKVKDNYHLVDLHEANISMNGKTEILEKVKQYESRPYGLTEVKVKIQVYGIYQHVTQDFLTYMNVYKMDNNKFSKYMLSLSE